MPEQNDPMAATPAPSSFTHLPSSREELAERWELAREPALETGGPKLRYLIGELSHLAEPVRRPLRRIDVPAAAEIRTVMLLPGFATHPIRMRYMAKFLFTRMTEPPHGT